MIIFNCSLAFLLPSYRLRASSTHNKRTCNAYENLTESYATKSSFKFHSYPLSNTFLNRMDNGDTWKSKQKDQENKWIKSHHSLMAPWSMEAWRTLRDRFGHKLDQVRSIQCFPKKFFKFKVSSLSELLNGQKNVLWTFIFSPTLNLWQSSNYNLQQFVRLNFVDFPLSKLSMPFHIS